MPLPKKRVSTQSAPRPRPRPKAPVQNQQRPPVEMPHYVPEQHANNGGVNAPQFPGWQKGHSQEEVQAFIRDQVRRKGFKFTGGTSPVDFKLELSGSARFFYGLTFENIIGTVTLMINNEQVFENVSTAFLQFGATNQDYYAVNRPLSGQDSIVITITGFAGYVNEQMEVVYK